MSLKICSLFSGSTGNCTFIEGGGTQILIDAGVNASKIEKALKVLGANIENINILITHRHSDHISGLCALTKKYGDITVYAHAETADDIVKAGVKPERIKVFEGADFYVGGITVSPVPLSHDVYCVGFTLMCGGKKIAYLTDTGVLPEYALNSTLDSDLVMIECNHSTELLAANKNYSYPLKKRIAGLRGHLSNADCAAALLKYARAGVGHFILAHLSRENNYPELAYSECYEVLDSAGYGGVGLTVALPDKLSGLIEIV